eukprot:SAG11_NODE_1365_length_5109_cov_2.411976_6_plen_160_part_00
MQHKLDQLIGDLEKQREAIAYTRSQEVSNLKVCRHMVYCTALHAVPCSTVHCTAVLLHSTTLFGTVASVRRILVHILAKTVDLGRFPLTQNSKTLHQASLHQREEEEKAYADIIEEVTTALEVSDREKLEWHGRATRAEDDVAAAPTKPTLSRYRRRFA